MKMVVVHRLVGGLREFVDVLVSVGAGFGSTSVFVVPVTPVSRPLRLETE